MAGAELIGQEELEQIKRIFEKSNINLYRYGHNNFLSNELEQKFANYMGVKYAHLVSSGTAAIHSALAAAGVEEGDEIITTAWTFVAPIEAIVALGAIPILANIDETFHIDPAEVEKLITNKTKAVVSVPMWAAPEMDDLVKMIELYKSGSTLKKIGLEFGIHRKKVSEILKDNDIVISRRVKNYISKDKLNELYINQELSSREIAHLCDFKDHKTVTRWLKKYDIPIRHKNYFTEKRRKLVSDKLKVSSILVTNNPMKNPVVIEKYKKTLKETGIRRGENNSAWKGGITPINAKIRNSMLFVGQGKTFQIWEPTTFEKFRVAARKKSNINRSGLKWELQFNN